MTIRCVRRSQSIPHSHELLLSLSQLVEPLVGKLVVGVDLEHEHAFSVMAEERVSIDRSRVLTAPVPGLPVENEHATDRRDRFGDVFEFQRFRREGKAALVGSRDASRRTEFGRELIEHPYRVHHYGRCHVQHFQGYVAVELLIPVAWSDDSRIETAQDERFSQEVFEYRQDPRMVDCFEEGRIECGEIGDVSRRSPVRMFRSYLLLAADERFAHLDGLILGEHAFEDRESVNFDLLNSQFGFSHDSGLVLE